MNEEELYRKAIEKWGIDSQIKMAIEEMAELIQVLAKYGRNINGVNIPDILEEIVDVEIMLKQLKMIFLNTEDLKNFYSDFKKDKLQRLEKLLNKEKSKRIYNPFTGKYYELKKKKSSNNNQEVIP